MRLSASSFGLALVYFTLGCPVGDKEVGTEGPGGTGETGATGTGGNSETGGADSGVTGSDGGDPNTSTTVPGNPTEGPIDSASETGFSDSGISESGDSDADSGSDGGDLPEPPPGCEIDTPDDSVFFTGKFKFGVLDEVCSVSASEVMGDALALTFDCPESGGDQSVIVESGPLPAAPPQVGDSLAVYWQEGDFDGFFEQANPELLFLRKDDKLVYASIRGYFIRDEDFTVVEAKAQPIGIELVAGPCPHVATGWEGGGDGLECIGEAVSQIELSADAQTVLGEHESAIIAVGGKSYAAELRQARHGQDCVDLDEQIRYTLALALQ